MKLKTALVDDIANLSFSCSGLGMGVAATTAGLSGGVLVAGAAAAGVIAFKALAKNCKAVPDSPRQLKRIQKGLLEKWAIIARENPDDMAAFDACQTPLRNVLSEVSVDPKTLATIIRDPQQPDFPSSATHYVLSRIAVINPRFANGIERDFAAAVIEAGFEAAIEDREYFEALEPHLLLGMARDVAQIRADQAALKDKVEETLDELKLSPRNRKRAAGVLRDMVLDDMTVNEIVAEILNRTDALERAVAQASRQSNVGGGFDELARIVAGYIDDESDPDKALEAIDKDFADHAEEDARRAAEMIQKYTLAIDTAIGAGSPEKVADYELRRIGKVDNPQWAAAVSAREDLYYQNGFVHGVRMDLRISAAICEQAADLTQSPEARAAIQNSLGIALATLGERGDDGALARSVTAFEAALEVYTRESAPMDWA